MDLIVWMIPLFPLLGFLLTGLGFKRLPRKATAWVANGTILLSFVFSLLLFIRTLSNPEPYYTRLFEWIQVGKLSIPFEFLVDPLSCLMLMIVTGVGLIIHVYSVGYMREDPGFNRFFSYMNLFIFSMVLLVMGANYPIMFIGWEGVGLCSYLLIGFWFRNQEFNNAAKKAFIMNRIGDLGFLLGMFLIFTVFGSLNFNDVFPAAKGLAPGRPLIIAITLLLFIGAIGKSAQIPLYTWLPDAMAGPTPVSALIHAATMVAAGVYMVARSGILYALAPLTMTIVGITGLITALFAASIAIFQNDIKKVLAYSTISQLGYMFLGLSVGAFTGAMFHLTTHAFFKALLFLAAGSVIHALHGEQDIRNMGGLKKALPRTFIVFVAGTLAIAGIPPLSGFFSKDEILSHVFAENRILWFFGVIGAVMTAFYMFRLLFLVFNNSYRGTSNKQSPLRESPRIMMIPLMILAFLSVFGGLINLPELFGFNGWLAGYLAPVFVNAKQVMGNQAGMQNHAAEWIIMAITLLGVVCFSVLAWQRYVKAQKGIVPEDGKRPWPVKLVYQKYRIDELYEQIIEKPVLWGSRVFHDVIDKKIIDGAVNGLGNLVIRAGSVLRYIQTGHIGFYLFMMVLGIICILFFNILF